jgi:hypothetical protein
MSAFGGKADMVIAREMSAYDQKRTCRRADIGPRSNNRIPVLGLKQAPKPPAATRVVDGTFLGLAISAFATLYCLCLAIDKGSRCNLRY